MIKVMGIDPGLASTGIGLVWGRGGSDPRMLLRLYFYTTAVLGYTPRRLEKIHDGIKRVAESEETGSLMIIEEVFSLGRQPKSGLSLGRVSGVVMLTAAQTAIPLAKRGGGARGQAGAHRKRQRQPRNSWRSAVRERSGARRRPSAPFIHPTPWGWPLSA